MFKKLITPAFAVLCTIGASTVGLASAVPSTPEQWAVYNANPGAWNQKYNNHVVPIQPASPIVAPTNTASEQQIDSDHNHRKIDRPVRKRFEHIMNQETPEADK